MTKINIEGQVVETERENFKDFTFHTYMKEKIVNIMQKLATDFGECNNFSKILIDVITECLNEAQIQVKNYVTFTQIQKDYICKHIDLFFDEVPGITDYCIDENKRKARILKELLFEK